MRKEGYLKLVDVLVQAARDMRLGAELEVRAAIETEIISNFVNVDPKVVTAIGGAIQHAMQSPEMLKLLDSRDPLDIMEFLAQLQNQTANLVTLYDLQPVNAKTAEVMDVVRKDVEANFKVSDNQMQEIVKRVSKYVQAPDQQDVLSANDLGHVGVLMSAGRMAGDLCQEFNCDPKLAPSKQQKPPVKGQSLAAASNGKPDPVAPELEQPKQQIGGMSKR